MKFSKIKLQKVEDKNFNYNSRKVKSTTEVVEFINNYEELDKATEEVILLICLNSKCQIVSYAEIARGGIDLCYVDIKTIFKMVLLCNASRFIIVHNHPSGDIKASVDDLKVTERIKKASEIMQVEFVDHIIIGNDRFVSCMKKVI